jgi:long-chain acyl-CoA synthetase
VREAVGAAFAEINRGLASYETLKAFEILPGDFTVAGGELTTSMKMRRREVEKKYRALLDRFYDGTLAQL